MRAAPLSDHRVPKGPAQRRANERGRLLSGLRRSARPWGQTGRTAAKRRTVGPTGERTRGVHTRLPGERRAGPARPQESDLGGGAGPGILGQKAEGRAGEDSRPTLGTDRRTVASGSPPDPTPPLHCAPSGPPTWPWERSPARAGGTALSGPQPERLVGPTCVTHTGQLVRADRPRPPRPVGGAWHRRPGRAPLPSRLRRPAGYSMRRRSSRSFCFIFFRMVRSPMVPGAPSRPPFLPSPGTPRPAPIGYHAHRQLSLLVGPSLGPALAPT